MFIFQNFLYSIRCCLDCIALHMDTCAGQDISLYDYWPDYLEIFGSFKSEISSDTDSSGVTYLYILISVAIMCDAYRAYVPNSPQQTHSYTVNACLMSPSACQSGVLGDPPIMITSVSQMNISLSWVPSVNTSDYVYQSGVTFILVHMLVVCKFKKK